MLLRNPADYKGGFWATYSADGVFCSASSTESESIAIKNNAVDGNVLSITLDHSPEGMGCPVVRFDIDVWSYNKPIMLLKHKTTNISNGRVEDLKVFNFMDFDVSGPTSYKDDIAKFDSETMTMVAYDEHQLFVALNSQPEPDHWEISPPIKLKVNIEKRDLKNNEELGPRDIATALQWSFGDLEPGENKTVGVVMASAPSLEDVMSHLQSGWGLYKEKFR